MYFVLYKPKMKVTFQPQHVVFRNAAKCYLDKTLEALDSPQVYPKRSGKITLLDEKVQKEEFPTPGTAT
jgi:hypothetical protein